MNTLVYEKPKVVAEIGCNHKGDFLLAKEMIMKAKDCGADYVKFQKRHSKSLLTASQYDAPHPNPKNSYGETYGKHREFLEFDAEQHEELSRYCAELGVGYSTSVWDVKSADEIIKLKPKFIKVPSACNNNFELLASLRDNFEGQVQISVGMTKGSEIESIVNFFEEKNQANNRLMLYACTSGYPVPPKDAALLEVTKLYEVFGERVSEIGYSGHHTGIFLDISAYTLGARWIERHFTLDKTWKGTDHAASLEPWELQELVSALNDVHLALNYKGQDILPIEEVQRRKLKWKQR